MCSIVSVIIGAAVMFANPWPVLDVIVGLWIVFLMLGILVGRLETSRYVPGLFGLLGIGGAILMGLEYDGIGVVILGVVVVVMYASERRLAKETFGRDMGRLADEYRKHTPEVQEEAAKRSIAEIESRGIYNPAQMAYVREHWRALLYEDEPVKWKELEELGD